MTHGLPTKLSTGSVDDSARRPGEIQGMKQRVTVARQADFPAHNQPFTKPAHERVHRESFVVVDLTSCRLAHHPAAPLLDPGPGPDR